MMTAAASALKTGVVVEVVFYVVAVVEMIANYFTIVLHNKITAICIISPFPFFCSILGVQAARLQLQQ